MSSSETINDGIDNGITSGERFGQFVYWLMMSHPRDKFPDHELESLLRNEYPHREASSGSKTFQAISAYRSYAKNTPDRLGIRSEREGTQILARIDAKMKDGNDSRIQSERSRREEMWQSLLDEGGPQEVAPGLLRKLGIYGGAQGIWVDKQRTGKITDDGVGITVGVLHTGKTCMSFSRGKSGGRPE
jgi:hypothetical protein